MAIPNLASVASLVDNPRNVLLAKWLSKLTGQPFDNFTTLPENQLYARIAVGYGGPLSEAGYLGSPKNYSWRDIYNSVSGSQEGRHDWIDNQAFGYIAAALRGDEANPEKLSYYLNLPTKYKLALCVDNSIDTDAEAFLATSGATDRLAINNFVIGVKELGLYSSMVCWPLRSSQNAGSGTTAYSLGGLGVGSGTLIDGPTWGADGITFVNASTQRIETTFSSSLASDMLLGGVAKFTDTGIRFIAGLGTGPTTRAYELTQGSATILSSQAFGSTAYAPTINHSATRGLFEIYASLVTDSGTTTRIIFGTSSNAATSAAHVPLAGSHALAIGAQGAGFTSDRNMEGDIAVVFFVRGTAATLANYLSLRLLIKTTLGLGLSLP